MEFTTDAEEPPEEPGRRKPWMPPGADADVESEVLFGDETESRLLDPRELLTGQVVAAVMAVNDFHFAMVNDHPRNEFFEGADQGHQSGDARVLQIGTGSGLLAMIAAQLGAQHVTAIEANGHMAALARGTSQRTACPSASPCSTRCRPRSESTGSPRRTARVRRHAARVRDSRPARALRASAASARRVRASTTRAGVRTDAAHARGSSASRRAARASWSPRRFRAHAGQCADARVSCTPCSARGSPPGTGQHIESITRYTGAPRALLARFPPLSPSPPARLGSLGLDLSQLNQLQDTALPIGLHEAVRLFNFNTNAFELRAPVSRGLDRGRRRRFSQHLFNAHGAQPVCRSLFHMPPSASHPDGHRSAPLIAFGRVRCRASRRSRASVTVGCLRCPPRRIFGPLCMTTKVRVKNN